MSRTMNWPCRRDLACYRNDGHHGECAYPTPDTAPRHVPAAEPRPCPACGEPNPTDDHAWWPVGDDSYACSQQGAVPAAEPPYGQMVDDHYGAFRHPDQAVPAADDRERLVHGPWCVQTITPESYRSFIHTEERCRAIGSPSTGDAERLHEAIRAVYYEDKHSDLSGGLTTDPADARLAAAILRRLG